MLDIPGKDQFHNFEELCNTYIHSDLAFLVFDLNSSESFYQLQTYMDKIKHLNDT
jgi:hypothetical protein